jgi:hypothetical protein
MLGKWIFYLNAAGDYSLVTVIRIYGTGKVDVRNVKGNCLDINNYCAINNPYI